MTTDTITKLVLTATDTKVLRNADSIVFRYVGEDAPENLGERGTFVDCTKSFDPGDGFGVRDLHQRIVLPRSQFTVYENNGDTGRTQPTSAVWVLQSARVWPEVQTMISMLRPGDELVPMWTADANKRLKRHKLTLDELGVRIFRPTRNGRPTVLTLALANAIVEPDSPVRNLTF